jgi:hypothetical protein
MILANHCDEVMEAIIRMSGRKGLLIGIHLSDVERRLLNALTLLQELRADGDSPIV